MSAAGKDTWHERMFDLKHLYRAGRADGRKHGLLPSVGFPPKKNENCHRCDGSVLIPPKSVVKSTIGSPVLAIPNLCSV